METVYNIKIYACLNYLFEKSHVKYMHTALLPYLSDFYYVQDTKSTHGNDMGRVIHHCVLMVGKKYKVVLSEGKMPDLHGCRAILVRMLRGSRGCCLWGSAGTLQLLAAWETVIQGQQNRITSVAVAAQWCESRTGCSLIRWRTTA